MSSYQKANLISVDEAIAKGRQMLMLPRILIMLGLFFFLFPTGLIFITLVDGPPFTTNIWLICGGAILFCFIVFFCLPFWFWSKQTTRWKLWAFDNVDNVHELKINGSASQLMPGLRYGYGQAANTNCR